jgi:hypothetical protein
MIKNFCFFLGLPIAVICHFPGPIPQSPGLRGCALELVASIRLVWKAFPMPHMTSQRVRLENKLSQRQRRNSAAKSSRNSAG